MKIAIVSLLCGGWVATTSAFTIMVPQQQQQTQPRGVVGVGGVGGVVTTAGSPIRSALAAGKPEDEGEEEGGLDLDLGEMFDMFDAADKEESFDEAIKKVKKGE
uniref:Uncharacterized protein n=1 Tax=Amphora coffeiformis TaxID=265554 RepID=A0A7S3P5L0_9STRA|mmetsp:Transcript_7151/g.13675  ORF Transcript_7151/g.13675 Transcript_7151/m.13675 type:complete len:104 (-) Transcript_7151:225-536(-)|eukprot:scaffold64_cov150-Amphora_coffeaeformis.AAC.3